METFGGRHVALAIGLLGLMPLLCDGKESVRMEVVPMSVNDSVGSVGVRMYRCTSDCEATAAKWEEIRSNRSVEWQERLKLCVTSSEDGFFTLWNVEGSKPPKKIFPVVCDSGDCLSPSEPEEQAKPISAGKEICLGDDEDFKFVGSGYIGEQRWYADLTATLAEALPADAYFTFEKGLRTAGVRNVERSANYSSMTMKYIQKGPAGDAENASAGANASSPQFEE